MRNNLNSQLMEQKMKVDFNSYDLSEKELISMVEDNLINIAPEYQRQFRWDVERQSSLIESLYLGTPVPAIFTATNADGSKRSITTILTMKQKFSCGNWSCRAGKRWKVKRESMHLPFLTITAIILERMVAVKLRPS